MQEVVCTYYKVWSEFIPLLNDYNDLTKIEKNICSYGQVVSPGLEDSVIIVMGWCIKCGQTVKSQRSPIRLIPEPKKSNGPECNSQKVFFSLILSARKSYTFCHNPHPPKKNVLTKIFFHKISNLKTFLRSQISNPKKVFAPPHHYYTYKYTSLVVT